MADFHDADLRGSRFERVDLSGAQLRSVDMAGAQFRAVDLSEVVMRGVELVNVDIYGEIVNVTVNGIDIGPLIDAELNRRYPNRAKMRPADPAGFSEDVRGVICEILPVWDLASPGSLTFVSIRHSTSTLTVGCWPAVMTPERLSSSRSTRTARERRSPRCLALALAATCPDSEP